MKAGFLVLAVLLPLRLDIPPANAGEEAAHSIEFVAFSKGKEARPQTRRFAHAEDIFKLERAMEEKADAVARKLLGPDRCKVIVNAECQEIFPVSSIKRFRITIVLDTSVKRAATERLSNVLANALDMRADDTMDVIRAPFAPTWKTIWYRPAFWGWLSAALIFITLLAAAARRILAVPAPPGAVV